ncbi:MAG: DNA polymerase III subunit gamma/tau, partial [Chloroflexi bacterium]
MLYRKWRPQTFEEVVGQEHVTRTLRNAIAMGRVGHAYLFSGPRGTGKTTTARLLAKAVNCLAEEPAERPCNRCDVCRAINEGRLLDLIEIDAASHTGVDDVRELRDKIAFRPNECRYKVYIIDEVHRFSGSAFDALLKTIEEPPPHAIFVLATTEIHKVPATIRSRCQQFDFRRIPVEQMVERLQRIVREEGLQAEPEALRFIARQATGSLRDAISLLDQLAAYNSGEITLAQAQAVLGTGTLETVLQLTDRLAAGDVAGGLNLINEAMDRGVDPRQLTRQLVEHLRGVLLLRLDGADLLDLPQEMRRTMADQAERFPVRRLLRAIRRFSQAEGIFRGGWHPQLPLEMAFVESCLDEEVASPADGAPAAAPRSPSASGPTSRPSPPSSPRPSEAPAGGQAAVPPAAGTTPAPKAATKRPARRPAPAPARPTP